MEFKVRVSKTTVTLASVPEGYGKKGFLKRLPAVLAKRPRKLVEDFLGFELDENPYLIDIDKNRHGNFMVCDVSFGNRTGKKYAGPDEVVYKDKIIVNRKNGIGIRLCFVDFPAGTRLDIL